VDDDCAGATSPKEVTAAESSMECQGATQESESALSASSLPASGCCSRTSTQSRSGVKVPLEPENRETKEVANRSLAGVEVGESESEAKDSKPAGCFSKVASSSESVNNLSNLARRKLDCCGPNTTCSKNSSSATESGVEQNKSLAQNEQKAGSCCKKNN